MQQKLILLFTCLLLAGISIAQQPCSADEHYRKLLKQYPQLEEYQKQFDAQVQQRMAARTTNVIDTNTYDVPIVVHVIHDYGIEDISDDAIFDAATYWAIVYMKQNADTSDVIPPFVPYVGDPKMRLHLATKDPNGNPTKGIVRLQHYLTNAADDQAKLGQWPQQNYVNIWLINHFGPDELGVAAYATFPVSAFAEPYYDGIICLYNYTDNTTKTIPHEMGHIMNLEHPWGLTNSPGVACGDDGVDDTPPTMGHSPSGCTPGALYDTVCASGYMVTYMSSSGLMDSTVDYPDTTNAQNIMDYTYCQKMFTKGQAARMRTALTGAIGGRSNLYAPANLAATGALATRPDLAPIPDYIVNNRCTGSGGGNDNRQYFMALGNADSFLFENYSWNDTITSVSWTFSNGPSVPSSTSTTSVKNTFSLPGWVTVALTATSNAGSTTLTNTNAVYVADTTPAGSMGYHQYFSSPSDISNWPMFNYYNNAFQWQFFNGAGIGDNSCIRYRSFDTSARYAGNAAGDHDDLFTPAFDLGGITGNLYLDFFSSGAKTSHGIGSTTYPALVGDSLEISASTDGGNTWTKLAYFGQSALADNGNYGYEYVPTSSAVWTAHTITIPNAMRAHNTYFRLRFRPGNTGNDLYIDNFIIDQFPAGIKETVNANNPFCIYPNPTNSTCTLLFKTGISGAVDIRICDITGKPVYTAHRQFMPNSNEQEIIDVKGQLPPGMYMVNAIIDGSCSTQKLVVY